MCCLPEVKESYRSYCLQMYENLYKRKTANGVSLDKVIQPACDNTGRIMGLIAGDEESYEVIE